VYGRMLILTHDRSMTDRRAAWKQRDAQGLVMLKITGSETDLAELLIACGLLPPATLRNPTRDELARAVEQLHAFLIAEHKTEVEKAVGEVSPHATLKFAFIVRDTDSHEGNG
jgi:hypothetical protein